MQGAPCALCMSYNLQLIVHKIILAKSKQDYSPKQQQPFACL